MNPHAPGTLLVRAVLGATTQSTALSAQGHGLHNLSILLQLIFPRDSLATGDIQGTRTGGHLGVQWLRILLPLQGTWVRSLVQEDATCCTATEPARQERLLHHKRSGRNEQPARGNQSSPHSHESVQPKQLTFLKKRSYNTRNNNGI